MINYFFRRLAALIPLLFGISALAFILISFCPGDPAEITLSALMGTENPPEEAVVELRRRMGLDSPLYVQYLLWLKGILSGNLGFSYQTGRSVVEEIGGALSPTIWLAGVTMVMIILVVVPVGAVAASRKGSIWDKAVLLGSLIFISMPDFFIALIFILIFALNLKLVPVAGYGGWENVLLPAFSLSLTNAVISVRLMRTSMLEVLEEKYIVTARAKGLKETMVVAKHALRNAALPVLTYVSTQFGYLFGGTVIIESIFMWPGLGRLLVESVRARDIFVVQGCILTIALIYILINLAVDILYAFIDPRICYDRTNSQT